MMIWKKKKDVLFHVGLLKSGLWVELKSFK